MSKKSQNEHGFTLVELAMVMMIGGVIMAMMFNFISVTQQNMVDKQNASKFKLVQAEINRFLETQGRFPCPASFTQPVGASKFGQEILANCRQNKNITGSFRTTGRLGNKIRIGTVPVRALNLPDEYIYDAYGSRLLYAVTEKMANASSYINNIGAIFINDANGNSTVIPAGSAPYVLLSTGKNQWGGYTGIEGKKIGGNCSSNPSILEKENCDQDKTFINTPFSEKKGSTYFDDKTATFVGSNNKGAVPASGVMYFDLAKCPTGWQIFYGTPPLDGMIVCKKI